MSRLRETLDDRLDARSAVGFAAIVAVSIVVFDAPPVQFAASMAGSAITGGAGLLADAYDLRGGVRHAGLGLASLFGGASLFALSGTVLLPAALATIGAWFVLDGVQSIRHGGAGAPPETVPDGEAMYRQYLARRVRELIDEQPRSRGELHEAMDAEPATIDATLADLRERGLVSLRAGVYHRDTPDGPGWLAQARKTLGRGAERLVRPFAVEFGDGDAYAEEETARPDETGRREADTSRETEPGTDDRREKRRERERAE